MKASLLAPNSWGLLLQPALWLVIGIPILIVGIALSLWLYWNPTVTEPMFQIAPYAPLLGGTASIVNAVRALHKDSQVPKLEFGGFSARQELINEGRFTAFYATTYSVEVKKTRGVGKSEACEGAVSVDDVNLKVQAVWLPDHVKLCDIGGSMDLVLFQLVPPRSSEAIIFSNMPTKFGSYLEFRDLSLRVEVYSKNAIVPKPFEKRIGEIIDEAKAIK